MVEKNRLLDRKDILIMIIMTLFYLAVALINLGGFKIPHTSWKPQNPGDSFVINLGRETEISRISYFTGLIDRSAEKNKFIFEYLDNAGKFQPFTNITAEGFYQWRFKDVSIKTNSLRIIVDSPNGELNEIGLFDKKYNKITGFKITEQNIKSARFGTPGNLFDEQDTVVYTPSFMNSTYFDEIYHARTAYEHMHRIEPYETSHPPLGKILIAFGTLIFGMNPFGWRIIGTLFGAAMIPLMYAFGKKMFNRRLFAFCTAFLMMFDFMHFTMTRIATIDVYATFFIILMYYFMYDYYVNKSYDLGFKQSLKPLFLSGLFFGIGAACKWIVLYGGGGLALLLYLAKSNEYKKYVKLKTSKKSRTVQWLDDFIPDYIIKTLIWCVLFFVIIPAVIYILSYIPFMMVPGPGHQLKDIIPYQVNMYNYHAHLVADHPYKSSWWQWPLMIKPLWLYTGSDLPVDMVSSIVSMGNPAIWWLGIPAVFLAIWIAIKKRDSKMTVVFTALAFQYLPWVIVSRLTFIYHFFSSVPFVILSIVYVMKYLMDKDPDVKYGIYAYLGITAFLFIMFYPVLSGMQVPAYYVDTFLRWFPDSWYF